jgi:hypothetical protein
MKRALVIFNGIRFPFYLSDHAVAWAKNNTAHLHALFLKAEDEIKEGYIFPSDLDAAENLADADDTEKDNIKVIRSQMKLLAGMAITEKLSFTSELLTDLSLDDLIALTKETDTIFIDADYDRAGILALRNFTIKDLVKKSRCPVEIVKPQD